jgi:NAD(P)-dependent dehydrogenase (short-subunit alcohol dehydrogenase family)
MKQNVCLVTGGAGFLGRKYCEFFVKKNYKVICVDNNKKKLKEIKSQKLKNLIVFDCDITNHNKVEKLFKTINKSFFVNVLINNAAIDAIPFKKKIIIQKFPTSEVWDNEINVALKGSFFMIKFFGEEMIKKNKGSIINIGSDLSVIAPNQAIYRSSYKNYIKPVTYSVIKHGIVGLTKYFASLYGKNSVRVNMVSPGPIKNNQSPKLAGELKKIIPMKRLGQPDEISAILFFLANDDSRYITGQNILVDGGRTII